jgi:head-tail adaptor
VEGQTTNTSNGQDVESFPSGAAYWCRVDEFNGRKQREYGAQQSGADATIYVRNWPELSALDRLTDGVDVWVIESIKRGFNELICTANRYDSLVLEDQ